MEAIRRIAKASPQDLSQCLQEVREDLNANDCRFERIVVVLNSDAETEPVSKKPKLSNVRSNNLEPSETEPTKNSQSAILNGLSASPAASKYHEPSTGCHSSSTPHPSQPKNSLVTLREPHRSSLTSSEYHYRSTAPPDEPTAIRDGLIKYLAEIKQLTRMCPCELQSRNAIEEEDFRIRDIQSETTKLNAFRASLAYLSLALEFHEYEAQEIKNQHGNTSVSPRLERLYAKDYARQKSTKRLSQWIHRKGFREADKPIRKHVETGQRLCVINKRLSDGWGLKSCSFIPIMIRTFMTRYFRSSHSVLERNMTAIISNNQIRQASIRHQNWLDTCYRVYHQRDSLPEVFQHTCGASDQSPSIDISSVHFSTLNNKTLGEESGTADRSTSPSTFDLMQRQPNSTTNAFAEDHKFWCK